MIGQVTATILRFNAEEAAFYAPKGRVNKDLMDGLRAHGMHCPIRGMGDPRLEHPEMLIITGWEREPFAEGYRYTYTADEDKDRNMRWQQVYESYDDGTSVLHTQAGRKIQTLSETPEGAIKSAIQIL